LDQFKSEQQSTHDKLKRMCIFIDTEKSQELVLRRYQQEYIEKIRDQQNVSISELNRYRSFCYQLEQALIQQQQKIALAEKQVQEFRKTLVKQQHRNQVLIKIIEKQALQQQLVDAKKQQIIIDELSLRRSYQETVD
jgi:flagellar export protein FliJ